ncbi:hypothetical protein BUALT_Bualt05G0160700 [Buddleja alternifolia]|uniref:non-specific serine/threonine protein kinase n=1 Tax=Buddleja alternifolia TaxID=168488 RepID=A0AAV6XSC9_9LAMI|nr:hypothetical protein BUALT_Bualt05G0160700 [Buddleja alternifolia]
METNNQGQKAYNNAGKQGLWCEHCQKTGHVMAKCFKIHGFLANYKPKEKRNSGNFQKTNTNNTGYSGHMVQNVSTNGSNPMSVTGSYTQCDQSSLSQVNNVTAHLQTPQLTHDQLTQLLSLLLNKPTLPSSTENTQHLVVKTLHDSSLNFKYSTLEKATASFDEANKIRHGGFGTVYKGVLADGRDIVVKRLFFNKNRSADFYNEINIISSVGHNNLVRLLGCSCSRPESLLVYEFLPNMSLDRFIFDSDKGKALSWEKRFEIIIGTTRGLAYLHENTKTRIIHRDIKASNILLDSRPHAKIAVLGWRGLSKEIEVILAQP